MRGFIAFAPLLLASASPWAEEIPGTLVTGTVIAVPEGDRLIMRTDDHQLLRRFARSNPPDGNAGSPIAAFLRPK